LHNKQKGGWYPVIYIGMARGQKSGMKSRLSWHSKKKIDRRGNCLWTHFSAYEVWDNVTQAEIEELEGLFRAIYRKDPIVNPNNQQKGFKKLKKVRRPLKTWGVLDQAIVDPRPSKRR